MLVKSLQEEGIMTVEQKRFDVRGFFTFGGKTEASRDQAFESMKWEEQQERERRAKLEAFNTVSLTGSHTVRIYIIYIL